MNLDELANRLRSGFSDPVVRELAAVVLEWKADATTAEDLRKRIERYIGNSWIGSDEDHKQVYGLWSSFRDEVIGGIGGMSMNERLYWFALFDRFDGSDEEQRLIVLSKAACNPVTRALYGAFGLQTRFSESEKRPLAFRSTAILRRT